MSEAETETETETETAETAEAAPAVETAPDADAGHGHGATRSAGVLVRLGWALAALGVGGGLARQVVTYPHEAAALGHIGLAGLVLGSIAAVISPRRASSLASLWVGVFLVGVTHAGYRGIPELPDVLARRLRESEASRLGSPPAIAPGLDLVLSDAGHRAATDRLLAAIEARRAGYTGLLPELARRAEVTVDEDLIATVADEMATPKLAVSRARLSWIEVVRSLEERGVAELAAVEATDRARADVLAAFRARGLDPPVAATERDVILPPARALAEALRDPDPAVRERVAELCQPDDPSLPLLDRPAVLRVLADALDAETETSVRLAIVAALAARSENASRSLEPVSHALLTATGDAEAPVRLAAAEALAVLGPRALVFLRRLLVDLRAVTRERGAASSAGGAPAPDRPADLAWANALTLVDAPVDELLRVIDARVDETELRRFVAAAVLAGREKTDASTDGLATAAGDAFWLVRLGALRGLDGRRSLTERAELAIVRALADADASVAKQARRFDRSRLTRGLALALRDAEERIRRHAIREVSALEPGVTIALLELLIGALDDESARVRRLAARAITRAGPRGAPAAPALVARLDDEDPEVVIEAIRCLHHLRATAAARSKLGILAESHPDESVRRSAEGALGTLDGSADH